ncbi:MAG TPA: bifunctional DNA-formamidopyrimidine glycosylase/DNA-(apurinic or apyrimidinic site) lyase [Solirubrobacteraceae bacterium]|jgi:formamidopyrimidine-DNA glycosylase|nr:bifunctional DNA-formamidopyrimidine glycosylase/DNA-(apurinic or apyrimidinic site) lyase [Solirubrobacteraceae bacterium]
MPELPEVETIRRQLAPHLEGRTLTSVDLRDFRWTQPAPPELIAAELTGAQVQKLGRLGKYLIWELDGDRHLLVHLRMTGSLLLDAEPESPYTHARFELDDGHVLTYVDPRRFGTAHLMLSIEARDAYLKARLGVEPFTPEFTAEYLRAQARGRTAPIKSFLLDQRRIAGIGNIYADEALHRAGVHPLRPAGSLTLAQWRALKDAIEVSLTAGIDAKGASIDDFRHVDGARGSFQDRFLVHTRAGEPCPTCGATIRKLFVGGRGTYVCEKCQPKPRARPGAA